jgi:hypothetical protein
MFSRGTSELIDRLPQLDGLTGTWARRRLSEAYLEVLATRELLQIEPDASVGEDIRRLVNALELYVLQAGREDEHLPAAAFVAAEALEIWSGALEGAKRVLLSVEAGLLFVIAGFDANAAAIAPSVADEGPASSEAWALESILRLLTQVGPDNVEPPSAAAARTAAITDALWRRVATDVHAHHSWLRGAGDDLESPGRHGLERLVATLAEIPGAAIQYPGPAHLTALLAKAARVMEARALRRLAPLSGLESYVAATVTERPLLWPGAERFASACLEALDRHAAVAVPTGSGKSAIAELAVVRALAEGWCLYLAPTNALVAQIRRDLRGAVALAGGEVRSFVGGGEYTTEEALDEAPAVGDVFVMTPEKCALALRQSSEAFETLRLLVLDECHLIGVGGTRGVVV